MKVDIQSRNLSIHERYELAQDNLGHPPLIAFIANLSSPLPSHQTVVHALEVLIQRFPLLRCKVQGWKTARPTWVPIPDDIPLEKTITTLDLDSFLPHHSFSDLPDSTLTSDQINTITTRLFTHVLTRGQSHLNIESGPLFHIHLVPRPSPAPGQGFFMMTLHHAVSDGMGFLHLFNEVLELCLLDRQPRVEPESIETTTTTTTTTTTDDKTSTKMTDLELPPPLEKGINVKLSWSSFFTLIYKEMIFPSLPLVLKHLIPSSPVVPLWPLPPIPHPESPSPISPHAKTLEKGAQEYLTAQLSHDLVTALSARAREKGVTIHAILTAALVRAISGSVQPSHPVPVSPVAEVDGRKEAHEPREEGTIRITIGIPMSERDARLGHPAGTGNYHAPSVFQWVSRRVSCRDSLGDGSGGDGEAGEEEFWQIAGKFNREKQALRVKGRQTWGLLTYLSPSPHAQAETNPEPAPIDLPASLRSRGQFTPWETFFGKKPFSAEPYDSSASLSNLGLYVPGPEVGGKVRGIVWAQTPSPFGAAGLELGVISLKGGAMGLGFSWRDGWVGAEEVGRIVHGFKEGLERLVRV